MLQLTMLSILLNTVCRRSANHFSGESLSWRTFMPVVGTLRETNCELATGFDCDRREAGLRRGLAGQRLSCSHRGGHSRGCSRSSRGPLVDNVRQHDYTMRSGEGGCRPIVAGAFVSVSTKYDTRMVGHASDSCSESE